MDDFVIVGAGVIGLALAWELRQRGLRVRVVDRQVPGMSTSTSWVGVGILPPPLSLATHDPLEQLRAHAHRLHPQWSQRLEDETGISNELRRCGGIYFARRAGEAASLAVSMSQASVEGAAVEQVDVDELTRLEPNLDFAASPPQRVFHLPEEMQVRSPKYLQALVKVCQQSGVQIDANVAVEALEVRDERVCHLETSKGTIQAGQFLLCTGAWSEMLLQPLGVVLPIEPWRGQVILWKTPEPLLSRVINEGYRYFVPRADGHLIAGATVEDVGFDGSTTQEGTEELRSFSIELVPKLRDYSIEQTWAGLRPRTPDGNPYMCRVPGFLNLAVSTGHYRSGLHLSPTAAVFMTQLLLGEPTMVDAAPFRFDR